jgi:hypothetical protein
VGGMALTHLSRDGRAVSANFGTKSIHLAFVEVP